MIREHRFVIAVPDLEDHSYFAVLVVDDVDASTTRACATPGGEILEDLRTEPWGMREFAARTVDGHRIMIGSGV
jgi:hypothetical protein